jgi:acyl dehydratase
MDSALAVDCPSRAGSRLDVVAIPAQGETLTYGRTFTVADVRAFADLSNDRGAHHVDPDREGRLLVHGLLTATIPTKLGGDLDYLAQEMIFRFHRPVFTGDHIECACTAEVVEDRGDRTYVEFGIHCTNQHGREVMTARTKGVILAREPTPTATESGSVSRLRPRGSHAADS